MDLFVYFSPILDKNLLVLAQNRDLEAKLLAHGDLVLH